MIETESATRTGGAGMPPELQSPRAKLVYLYLTTNDGGTVPEMASSLGMKKISLYGVLKTLRKQSLVARDDERFVPA